MDKNSVPNKTLLIPLYLGVAGHRDIREEDKELLKHLIKEFVEQKQIECPHTPVVLLTPLAEGADQIAAWAAVESKIDFIAVLPMPVEEYKKDFVSPNSALEFDSLLAKASLIIELPLQDGTSIENVCNHEKRNEQYYQSGLFIARQCHVLIALWDGTDNGKKGGTADVVKLKKTGIPGKFEDKTKRLRHLQTGPIYHIITPRKSNLVPDHPFTKIMYYPSQPENTPSMDEENDKEILRRIDSFNKDFIKLGSALKEKIEKSTSYLLPNHADCVNNLTLCNIAEKHGITSELATYFQKRRFLALKVLLSLVVLAFLFLHINTEFLHKPLILMLYPITMGIGALWFFIANREKFENKHEDYRALSEAYRVQYFLNACGKQNSVSDHYLKRHRGELEWVLYALRTSLLNDWKNDKTFREVNTVNQMKAFIFLKTNWVDDQLKYFRKTSIKHNLSAKKWELMASCSFISAIVAACLLFLVSFNAEKFPENLKSLEEIIHSVLSCSTSVLLVLAAALHGYSDKMVFAEQAKNYQQMAQLFQLASDKLDHAINNNDFDEANDIITELAQEALLENGDWLLLHRSRPMENPKG